MMLLPADHPARALPLPDVPGTLELLAVVGSHAYGLAGPGSDLDRLGAYSAPPRDLLGLDPAAASRTVTATDPDVAVHELGKLMGLALRANPTVTELLWAPAYLHATEVGELLVAVRGRLLSTPTVRAAYTGYARSQLARLADPGRMPARRAKHARHCVRLLLQARELLATGTLTLDVSDHGDLLGQASALAVADPSALEALTAALAADVESVRSVLPDRPDLAAAEDVLVAARLTGLGSAAASGRLRDAASDGEAWACDECGRDIVSDEGQSRMHARSCSLHPNNEAPAPRAMTGSRRAGEQADA